MTAGVSIDDWSADATFTSGGGTWSANYPITNLSNLYAPSKVGRVSGGTAVINIALAASSLVSIVAVCAHTMAAADTARVVCGAYDSGVVTLGAAANTYRRTQPFVFTELTASSVTVTLGFSGTIDIGAIAVGRFWRWPGISPGASIGVRPGAEDLMLAGGGAQGPETFDPRVYEGQIDKIAMATTGTLGLDFQKLGQGGPFVFVEDVEDPLTWPRTCFLARNTDLPPSVGAVYRHDTFQFRIVEHVH